VDLSCRIKTNSIPSLHPAHSFPLPLLASKTIHETPLHHLSSHKNSASNCHSPDCTLTLHTPLARIHSRPGTFNLKGENLSAQRTKNPPSIPTLALVWLVGWLRGSKVIIDWHNLGYSILALKLGANHVLVRIAKR
jgi:hypothetical protein